MARGKKTTTPIPRPDAEQNDAPPAPPPLGSEAFGASADGEPRGSQAVGGADRAAPLRGAVSIGNDAAGGPTGSEAFGGTEPGLPLKGAIRVGNDPAGEPTGSEAFGGAESAAPLKGALLFGNDPRGEPTGSESFGTPDVRFQFRGAAAVGAPQLVPERLVKDEIGYDFAGVMLRVDETSLAGIRKDPHDRLRTRIVAVLRRALGCEAARLRYGLNEDAIPWARLRRESDLDRELAELLRRGYQKAPGDTLGVGHVRDILQAGERMHTVALHCEWDSAPIRLTVRAGGEMLAYANSGQHKEQHFFLFRNPAGEALGYADGLVPRRREQTALIRDTAAKVLASVELQSPSLDEELSPEEIPRFAGLVRDARQRPWLDLSEEAAPPQQFRAVLQLPGAGDEVGQVIDRLDAGTYRTQLELDVRAPRLVAWGLAAILAQLARVRRAGWPGVPKAPAEPPSESPEAALGPRRKR